MLLLHHSAAATCGEMMTPPDYQTRIDAATWAFIRATEAEYPPDAVALTIAEQRAIYDRMCRRFFAGYPTGITARDETIAGVPCRVYPGAQPTVVYYHGGGYVVGGLDSHDDVCAELRAATGLTVVSVDYRLCPEHPHPAAFDDSLAVARAMSGPILLVGDSAGGNLAAAVAAAMAHQPQVLGQVLIYPSLAAKRSGGSYALHAHAPMLTAEDMAFYAAIRFGGAEPARPDPTAAPLAAKDFAGLPPTLAIAAECDPLADDPAAYATAIRAAGGKAHAITETGLVHGYLRARHSVPRARASFDRITSTVAAFARGEWPFGETP